MKDIRKDIRRPRFSFFRFDCQTAFNSAEAEAPIPETLLRPDEPARLANSPKDEETTSFAARWQRRRRWVRYRVIPPLTVNRFFQKISRICRRSKIMLKLSMLTRWITAAEGCGGAPGAQKQARPPPLPWLVSRQTRLESRSARGPSPGRLPCPASLLRRHIERRGGSARAVGRTLRRRPYSAPLAKRRQRR